MALTDEERRAALSARIWSFPTVQMRARLIELCLLENKTFADAVVYADTYGNGFENKTRLEKFRISELVNTMVGGVLDALIAGPAPKPHTLLGEGDLSNIQFDMVLYLLKNGETLSDAITGAQSVVSDKKEKVEAVLYFLICGKTLAEAKIAAGIS